MGFFSEFFAEEPKDRLERWRKELFEALPQALSPDDTFCLSEDQQEIIIKHGSTHVVVGFTVDEEGDGYVVIDSPLVFLPKENLLPFYRRLLDLNNNPLMLGSLSTEGNVVTLRRTMPIQGLDEEGFLLAVFSVCAQADELDDLLIEEFEASRFEFED